MNECPRSVVAVVPPLPEGWNVLKFKVLAKSRLAIIGVNDDLLSARRGGNERMVSEAWRVEPNVIARVWTFDGHDLIEAIQFPLLEPFPIVEQFTDGRWLVANSRSRGHGNARILRADGTEKRRFELGDGINHLRIDDHQHIWVGWFDEGIFGNDNWRLPGLDCAPSAFGIAAFDEQGLLVKHATLESIADCYALNVFGDSAWACTYTDFPIWQMANGRERVWPTNLSGVSALAVTSPYVLAAGGHKDAVDRAVLLRLDEQSARLSGEWLLPLGPRRPSDIGMIDGRDDELQVVRDHVWHRWHVSEFVKLSE